MRMCDFHNPKPALVHVEYMRGRGESWRIGSPDLCVRILFLHKLPHRRSNSFVMQRRIDEYAAETVAARFGKSQNQAPDRFACFDNLECRTLGVQGESLQEPAVVVARRTTMRFAGVLLRAGIERALHDRCEYANIFLNEGVELKTTEAFHGLPDTMMLAF